MPLTGFCINNLITLLSLCPDHPLTPCGPAGGAHPSSHPVTETPGHDGRCAQRCAGPPPAVVSGEGQGSACPVISSLRPVVCLCCCYFPRSCGFITWCFSVFVAWHVMLGAASAWIAHVTFLRYYAYYMSMLQSLKMQNVCLHEVGVRGRLESPYDLLDQR